MIKKSRKVIKIESNSVRYEIIPYEIGIKERPDLVRYIVRACDKDKPVVRDITDAERIILNEFGEIQLVNGEKTVHLSNDILF